MIRFLKNSIHKTIAWIAVLRFGFPGRKMTVIGVTGTDGKTTTTHLIYTLLKDCGKKVSMVSTIAAVIGKDPYDTGYHVTTPSAWQLQQFMHKAVKEGSTHFVLEITSHALDQGRVEGAFVDISVITNISHEHLDYHGTFENYRRTKVKILRGVHLAIINRDDKNYAFIKSRCSCEIKSFGQGKNADYSPLNTPLISKLPGMFNVYNNLAAYATGAGLSLPDSCMKKSLASFAGIPGRMEELSVKKPFRIFIDFAHKPNALQEALRAGRSFTKKRLIVVFGCAGLRDRKKRPMMGEIAAKLADDIVITAEDPRTEDVREISESIAVGCLSVGFREAKKTETKIINDRGHKKKFWRIPDRQEAINFAIRKLARAGDVVLLCGKGHETSMCYGTIEYPWDEKAAVMKALYVPVSTSLKTIGD